MNAAVAQQARRPRHLLVIVNPYGGSKRARALCQSVVRPVFDKAGVCIWQHRYLIYSASRWCALCLKKQVGGVGRVCVCRGRLLSSRLWGMGCQRQRHWMVHGGSTL